ETGRVERGVAGRSQYPVVQGNAGLLLAQLIAKGDPAVRQPWLGGGIRFQAATHHVRPGQARLREIGDSVIACDRFLLARHGLERPGQILRISPWVKGQVDLQRIGGRTVRRWQTWPDNQVTALVLRRSDAETEAQFHVASDLLLRREREATVSGSPHRL